MRNLPAALKIVAIAGGAINIGTFGVAPFLAVLMVQLGYSVGEIGVVLAANLVMTRVFPLFAGLLGDRTRHVTLMIAGLVIRAGGLAAFAASTEFWWFAVCSGLVGLGAALYEPNASALLAHEPNEEVRARGYTLLNMAQNVGALGGPLVGGLLIAVNPRALFLITGAVMLLVAGAFAAKRHELTTPNTGSPILGSLGRVFTNGRFLRFGAAMGLFWFVDAQFHTSLPIYATQLTGTVALAGTVLVVNGISGLLAAIALRKQFERRPALRLCAAGLVVVAGSIAAIAVFPAIWWLLLCVAVYTIGETLIFVSADVYIAEVADKRDAGAFFGGHDVFWAIGGTIGYFAGTALVQSQRPVIWPLFAVAALAALAVLIRDVRRRPGPAPAAADDDSAPPATDPKSTVDSTPVELDEREAVSP